MDVSMPCALLLVESSIEFATSALLVSRGPIEITPDQDSQSGMTQLVSRRGLWRLETGDWRLESGDVSLQFA